MSYLGNSPGVASQRIVTTFTATAGQTTFTPSSGYALGYCDVFQNGVKLVNGDDYTASNGTTVVLATGASAGDSVEVVAYIPRGLSDGYTKAENDALLAQKLGLAGGAVTGQVTVQRNSTISTSDFYASSPTLRLQGSGTNAIAGLYLDSQGPTGGRAAAAVYAEPIPQDNWRANLVHVYTADGEIGSFSVRQFHPANGATYERLKVDSGGRVTMPYQPCFLARGLSNAYTNGGTSSNGILLFNEVMVNNGSNYSASTGRFTAPVGGNYFFTLNTLFDDSWSSSNGGVDVRRNGIRYFNLYYGIMSSGSYNMASASGVIFMNAGDYVDVQANLPGIHTGTDTSFSGYLIG